MTIELERSLERWEKSDAKAMTTQSEAAITFAFVDAKKDIAALGKLARRVAKLNQDATSIDAGLLALLIEEARRLTK